MVWQSVVALGICSAGAGVVGVVDETLEREYSWWLRRRMEELIAVFRRIAERTATDLLVCCCTGSGVVAIC